MLNSRYPDQVCSVARSLEVVGERWSLLILRDAMFGVRRFEAFQMSLGIARNVLTDRLDHLVTEDVLARRPYGARQDRFDYELTEKGRGLAVAVLALMEWGDRYYPTPGGPPRLSQHRECGERVGATMTCSRHGSDLTARDLMLLPGPGAPALTAGATVEGRPG
jgi:DNA-binding HxlR family transcriptional regulator